MILDPGVEKILIVVLAILCFFTILFYSWKWIKPIPILKEMITRTHSWWIIYFLCLIFFCIDPRLGQVGLALVGLFALRELLTKLDVAKYPAAVQWLTYFFVGAEFFLAARGSLLPALVIVPGTAFIAITVWTLLFEEPKVTMTAPALALWSMILVTSGLVHLTLLLGVPHIPGWTGSLAGLFLYYVFLIQFNDVLQFIWGSLLGRRPIAPKLSPKKTWEGFLGGVLTTTLLAFWLRDITPFSGLQSLIVGFGLGITGYLGDLNISAIKRNLAVKDMGGLIPGHGGLLDRMDSVTLSSLLYFYLIVYWFDPLMK